MVSDVISCPLHNLNALWYSIIILYSYATGPRSAIGRVPDPKSGVLGSIPGLATYFHFSFQAVISYWRKYVHEVLVNRLGGLSLPKKSVVRLTGRPDMTLDVYRGRKTTIQQHTATTGMPNRS